MNASTRMRRELLADLYRVHASATNMPRKDEGAYWKSVNDALQEVFEKYFTETAAELCADVYDSLERRDLMPLKNVYRAILNAWDVSSDGRGGVWADDRRFPFLTAALEHIMKHIHEEDSLASS